MAPPTTTTPSPPAQAPAPPDRERREGAVSWRLNGLNQRAALHDQPASAGIPVGPPVVRQAAVGPGAESVRSRDADEERGIGVAATADHGGANSHRTMEALSVVSHVGNSEDYGCGQCRRLGRSSKTEGRQDDSLQRESTGRPFAVSGLRSWSTMCASRIIATCCSCRCRRVGADAGCCHRWRRDEHEPDHRVVVGLPTIRRQPNRFDDVRFVSDPVHDGFREPGSGNTLVHSTNCRVAGWWSRSATRTRCVLR